MTNGLNARFLISLSTGLAILGIGGAVTVFGRQMGMAQQVKQNESSAQKCCKQAQKNEVAIGKILEWIAVDRERTEREHKENQAAHTEIKKKLDRILERKP